MEKLHQLLRPILISTLLLGALAGSARAQECNIVVEAATQTGNGIVEIPGNDGAAAFALATTNVGATCSIDVGALASPLGVVSGGVPVTITLCQTNPENAQCINPNPPGRSVSLTFAANAQPTFSVFVQASGAIPANSQVCVFFFDPTTEKDDGSICVPLKNE